MIAAERSNSAPCWSTRVRAQLKVRVKGRFEALAATIRTKRGVFRSLRESETESKTQRLKEFSIKKNDKQSSGVRRR